MLRRLEQSAVALSGALQVNCFFMDAAHGAEFGACPGEAFCHQCRASGLQSLSPHWYGVNEARRWGGRYIYYCPVGLTFIAGAASDETGALVGGLVLGPLVMGEVQDVLPAAADPVLLKGVQSLPVVSTLRARQLEEVLVLALQALAPGKAADNEYDQQSFLNAMVDIRQRQIEGNEDYAFIFTAEKRLQALIAQRDREASQELLNELLGHIYFTHGGDTTLIKARVIELAVVLSRAAVAAGADVAQIFRFSPKYLKQIEDLSTIDELSIWLSGLVHRFISASFDYERIKHADVVHKVMDYIRKNAHLRLSLEDIAGQVYLSKSYLSSIFKQEMGMSISTFINRVRVERCKRLLRETNLPLAQIAAEYGFEDQSYFSKVFKRFTGMTPKQYRDSQL